MLRHMKKRMATSLAIAALFVGAADVAKAVGTLAGTTVSNTASVTYSVNAVAQPAVTGTADFVVDRMIDLTLTTVPVTYVTVTPATNGVIPLTLTNTGNAPQNFNLAAANTTDPYLPGADTFDPTTNSVFVDSNANSTYDPGVDTATVVDTLANDASITVFIVSAIPGGTPNAGTAGVTMTATARETTANGGGAVPNDLGNPDTVLGMETVWADGAGDTDGVRDAAFSDTGAFQVSGANVTVTKSETLISDPINGLVNPKHIPGAVVEYQVVVTNLVTSAVPATTITLTDVLPANVTFATDTYGVGNGIDLDGVAKTNLADADEGTFGAGTVTVTVPDLNPGVSSTITFRVTVN